MPQLGKEGGAAGRILRGFWVEWGGGGDSRRPYLNNTCFFILTEGLILWIWL